MASARRTLLKNFMLSNPIYAGCEVTIYVVDENNLITAIEAELFEDTASAVQLANPQTLDNQGKFAQPVYFEQDIICVIDGLGVGQEETGIIRPQVSTTDIDNVQTLAIRAISERLDEQPLSSSIPI